MLKCHLRAWVAIWFFAVLVSAQTKPRARDLGVPFDGIPGPFNAITDVKGVEVGHTTLISGEGPLKVGEGPVRTGVTAVLPRGRESKDGVFAAWFTENGNGEMTGTTWVGDSGFLDGPVMITNTHSVGVVRDAVIAWKVKHGDREQLRIAGVPVGKEIPENPAYGRDQGSIIVIVATDAPVIPTQLKRVARRVTLGLGRDGSYSGDGSGDIFIAFSTANAGAIGAKEKHEITMLPNEQLDPIFLATVQATEEAVINAMVAAVTMTGINDHKVIGLPHERLREVLRKYNRLVK